MMAGEQLCVGHEPRHGRAYVASWVKAFKDEPREIRLAAVDAQKAADWIVEPERTIEREPPSVEQERVIDGRSMRHRLDRRVGAEIHLDQRH